MKSYAGTLNTCTNFLEESKNYIIPQIICLRCRYIPSIAIIPGKNPKIYLKCSRCKTKKIYLISEYLEEIKKPVTCYLNKNHVGTDNIQYCEKCAIHLCSKCISEHKKIGLTHDLISFSNRLINEMPCPLHNSNSYIYFCMECDKHLCEKCNFFLHKNHALVNLEKMSKMINKNSITKNIVKFQNYIREKLLNTMNEICDKLKLGDNFAIENIYNSFSVEKESLINILNLLNDSYNHKCKNYYQIKNIYENCNILFSEFLCDFSPENKPKIKEEFLEYLQNSYSNITVIYNQLSLEEMHIIKEKDNKFINTLIDIQIKEKEYINSLMQGKFTGRGVCFWSNNDKYLGYYKDNQFNGKGIYYWSANDKYFGEWKNNQRDSQIGIYYFSHGSKYIGGWKNNKENDKGIYYGNKGKFIGKWNNGYRKGIYYWQNNQKYFGELNNGKLNGYGKHYGSFDIYYGYWKNDKENGYGTCIWNKDEYYFGYWKNGLKHGRGAFINKKGGKYIGLWKNDFRCGIGIEYFDNYKYFGQWMNSKKNGVGIQHSKHSILIGEFVENNACGYCIEYAKNKDFYEGIFDKNKRNGIGIFYINKKNEKYEGEFNDNYINGIGTYFYNSGDKYQGIFNKNKENDIGILTFVGDYEYQGEIKNGYLDGYGLIFYEDKGKKSKVKYKDGIKLKEIFY